jgi:hypothetical protein
MSCIDREDVVVMYVYMNIYVYMNMHIYEHMYGYVYVHVIGLSSIDREHACIHIHIHTYTHTYMQPHILSSIPIGSNMLQVPSEPYIRTYIHTHIHAAAHPLEHTQRLKHASSSFCAIHTYAHTHTHTYMQPHILSSIPNGANMLQIMPMAVSASQDVLISFDYYYWVSTGDDMITARDITNSNAEIAQVPAVGIKYSINEIAGVAQANK